MKLRLSKASKEDRPTKLFSGDRLCAACFADVSDAAARDRHFVKKEQRAKDAAEKGANAAAANLDDAGNFAFPGDLAAPEAARRTRKPLANPRAAVQQQQQQPSVTGAAAEPRTGSPVRGSPSPHGAPGAVGPAAERVGPSRLAAAFPAVKPLSRTSTKDEVRLARRRRLPAARLAPVTTESIPSCFAHFQLGSVACGFSKLIPPSLHPASTSPLAKLLLGMRAAGAQLAAAASPADRDKALNTLDTLRKCGARDCYVPSLFHCVSCYVLAVPLWMAVCGINLFCVCNDARHSRPTKWNSVTRCEDAAWVACHYDTRSRTERLDPGPCCVCPRTPVTGTWTKSRRT